MSTPAFQYARRLFHHETDGDRVCHFSNYFRIFEEAMMEFLRARDVPLEHAEHSLAVVVAHADYVSPIRFGEMFTVTLALGEIRRSWFELNATLSGEGDGPRARMALKLAAISRDTGESVPLSPKLRALLADQ
jgi:YbgC/YbaW family acyl-CoA thioester hydrolase